MFGASRFVGHCHQTGRLFLLVAIVANLALTDPSLAAAASQEATVIAESELNVRLGPGTEYGVLTKIKRGERYTVLESAASGDWVRIQLPSATGWVKGTYVEVSDVSSDSDVLVFLILIAVASGGVLLLWWFRRSRRQATGWQASRVLRWNNIQADNPKVHFAVDLENLIGREAAVDRTPLREGEEIMMCLACCTVYRPSTVEWVRRRNNGLCVSCRTQLTTRRLVVRSTSEPSRGSGALRQPV